MWLAVSQHSSLIIYDCKKVYSKQQKSDNTKDQGPELYNFFHLNLQHSVVS